ncbi:hypothetical protein V9T40_013127 [Parthenolecanium corni]|uniref:Uncharacterized protein n=1 Tax=Parthenolecanium corni TaxID=536013 RepID=A0AAN9Y6L9_9HEMI
MRGEEWGEEECAGKPERNGNQISECKHARNTVYRRIDADGKKGGTDRASECIIYIPSILYAYALRIYRVYLCPVRLRIRYEARHKYDLNCLTRRPVRAKHPPSPPLVPSPAGPTSSALLKRRQVCGQFAVAEHCEQRLPAHGDTARSSSVGGPSPSIRANFSLSKFGAAREYAKICNSRVLGCTPRVSNGRISIRQSPCRRKYAATYATLCPRCVRHQPLAISHQPSAISSRLLYRRVTRRPNVEKHPSRPVVDCVCSKKFQTRVNLNQPPADGIMQLERERGASSIFSQEMRQ